MSTEENKVKSTESDNKPVTTNSPLLVENFCREVNIFIEDFQAFLKTRNSTLLDDCRLTVGNEILTREAVKNQAHGICQELRDILKDYLAINLEVAESQIYPESRHMIATLLKKLHSQRKDLALYDKVVEIEAEIKPDFTVLRDKLNQYYDNFEGDGKLSNHSVDPIYKTYCWTEIFLMNNRFVKGIFADYSTDKITSEIMLHIDIKVIEMTLSILETLRKPQEATRIVADKTQILNEIVLRNKDQFTLICSITQEVKEDERFDDTGLTWGLVREKFNLNRMDILRAAKYYHEQADGLPALHGLLKAITDSQELLKNQFDAYKSKKACKIELLGWHQGLTTKFNWLKTGIEQILNDEDRTNLNKLMLWEPTRNFCAKLLTNALEMINSNSDRQSIVNVFNAVAADLRAIDKHYTTILEHKENNLKRQSKGESKESGLNRKSKVVNLEDTRLRVYFDDVWKFSLHLDDKNKQTYRLTIVGDNAEYLIRQDKKTADEVHAAIVALSGTIFPKKLDFKIIAKLDDDFIEFATFSTPRMTQYKDIVTASLIHLK